MITKDSVARVPSNEFSDLDKELASFAKALAHPARIAILRVRAKRDSCVCGEIVDELPLSQSTVSQHLKALKSAGLIKGEIDGPKVCYCLEPEAIMRVSKILPKLVMSVAKDVKSLKQCC